MGLFNFKKPAPKAPSIDICGLGTPYNIEDVAQQIITALQPAQSIIPSFALGEIAKLEVIKLLENNGTTTKHAHMVKVDTGGNIFDAYVDSNGRVIKAQWNAWPNGDNSIGFKALLDTYRSDSLYIKEIAALFNK